LTYKHEDGMNYARAFDRIIVGSCPQNASDVDTLKKEGVGIIFCLQQDSDMAHFNLDIEPIRRRSEEVGIAHVREPIPDFDPLSLRRHLPAAVKRLVAELDARPAELAYIHCTAGLGRAPGLALAYMFMIEGSCLDEAYERLFAVRRCHPQLGMIRAAVCDLLSGDEGGLQPILLSITRKDAQAVQVAGLDVGWGNRLTLQKNERTGAFELTHLLPPGRYQYKFIVDGVWMPSMDLPTVDDNGNINNVVDMEPQAGSPDADRRQRLMASRGQLRPDELEELKTILRPKQT
jgi:hypothetical protein